MFDFRDRHEGLPAPEIMFNHFNPENHGSDRWVGAHLRVHPVLSGQTHRSAPTVTSCISVPSDLQSEGFFAALDGTDCKSAPAGEVHLKFSFSSKETRKKTNGTVPLYCRITVDGSEARFGMKCDANPKLWDVKTGKVAGRTAEAVRINALVDSTKVAIFRIYRELQERDNYVTAEKIKNVFLGLTKITAPA
ncbi:MAG: hypothetical protein LBE56_03740 [Tannerella sp.]|nr:hypothetical protein [Tannerella sp.]